MVVDFGNSRTGALLMEMAGEVSQTAEMMPFELFNRYSLDAWNDEGEQISRPGDALVLLEDPLVQHALSGAARDGQEGILSRDQERHLRQEAGGRERETYVKPNLFDDFRWSAWAARPTTFCQIMRAEGDIRTGLSSPKRYLWADDASWLEGANWYMADPADRDGTDEFAAKLHGPLLNSSTRTTATSCSRKTIRRRTSSPRWCPSSRATPRAA